MVHFDYASLKSVNGYFNTTDKSKPLGAPATDNLFQASFGRTTDAYYFPGGFCMHWGYRESPSYAEFALPVKFESVYGVFGSRLQSSSDRGAIAVEELRHDTTTGIWYLTIDSVVNSTNIRDSFYYLVIGKAFQDPPVPSSSLTGVTHWDSHFLTSSTNYFENLYIANADNTGEVKFNMNGSYVNGGYVSNTTLARGGVTLPLDLGLQWGTGYNTGTQVVYATPFDQNNNFIFTSRLSGSSTSIDGSAITGTPNNAGFNYDPNIGDVTKDNLTFFAIGNRTLT